jgi:hypothetical protein
MNSRTASTWLMLLALLCLTLTLAGRHTGQPSQVTAQVAEPVKENRDKEEDPRDIHKECQRQALQDTAQFVNKHMIKAKSFASKWQLLEHSLASVPAELKGLYCEFGVYKGESVNFIASKTPNTVHGFDSFDGLPEDWREGFEKGTFQMNGLPTVRANVRLVKGWFNESVPGWCKQNPGPLAFAHMDADLYSSTKCVLDLLADRIVPGTVLQFDEFFNYPGWQEGEYKAFTEFVAENRVEVKYLGYVFNHEQAAVQVISIGK